MPARSRRSCTSCHCSSSPTIRRWRAARTSTSRATWRNRLPSNRSRGGNVRIHDLAIAAALALSAGPATAQNDIQWWPSMGGAVRAQVNELAAKFNASQKDYKVVPVYKGQYPESMPAAIAAYRAGNAPHIPQVFEVGTATMMAAKGAIVPVAKVMADAGEPFNPSAYLPSVAGYYTDVKGNMFSLPFNSSTALFYTNNDALKKAGVAAPKTWNEFAVAADKLKAAGF